MKITLHYRVAVKNQDTDSTIENHQVTDNELEDYLANCILRFGVNTIYFKIVVSHTTAS